MIQVRNFAVYGALSVTDKPAHSPTTPPPSPLPSACRGAAKYVPNPLHALASAPPFVDTVIGMGPPVPPSTYHSLHLHTRSPAFACEAAGQITLMQTAQHAAHRGHWSTDYLAVAIVVLVALASRHFDMVFSAVAAWR